MTVHALSAVAGGHIFRSTCVPSNRYHQPCRAGESGSPRLGDPKLFDWVPLSYIFDVMDAVVLVSTRMGR